MNGIRRDHKSSFFQKLFGDESNKGNLLALYNALNNTDYDDVSSFEINTLEDVIYMGMKNDISCIIDNYMALSEHQSTYNPNMPLRGLMYFARLYDKYIKQNAMNMYSSKLLKIPTPKYYVFYNGNTDKPDISHLKLSDSFIHMDENNGFEWTATMININYGHNKELMDSCRILKEYSIFISKIKGYINKKYSIEMAVKMTVDECIQEGILRNYLLAHKAEVIGMCITEYNEQETMNAIRQESRNEGIEEGIKKGIYGAIDLLRDMEKNDDEIKTAIMKQYHLSEQEAQEFLSGK